jgi:hypothetical protein
VPRTMFPPSFDQDLQYVCALHRQKTTTRLQKVCQKAALLHMPAWRMGGGGGLSEVL